MNPVLIWKPDPNIVRFEEFTISWYGLLFGLGFLAGRQIVITLNRKERRTDIDADGLLIVMILGTVVGARLGHCLVYEPAYYIAHPLDVLKIWKGGLASHGAALGVLVALGIFARVSGDRYLWIVDRIAIVAALAGALVRIGNFVNSEMVGVPTEGHYGVVFARAVQTSLQQQISRIDRVTIRRDDATSGSGTVPLAIDICLKSGEWVEANLRTLAEGEIQFLLRNDPRVLPHIAMPTEAGLKYDLTKEDGSEHIVIHTQGIMRHPTQVYEALCYFIISVVLFRMWAKQKEKLAEGLLTGLFLVFVFSSRFLIEFVKVDQVPAEVGLPLNFGQLLSIPFVAAGIVLLLRVKSGHDNRSHAPVLP